MPLITPINAAFREVGILHPNRNEHLKSVGLTSEPELAEPEIESDWEVSENEVIH